MFNKWTCKNGIVSSLRLPSRPFKGRGPSSRNKLVRWWLNTARLRGMGVDRQPGWLSWAGKVPPCTPLGFCTSAFGCIFRTCVKAGAGYLGQLPTRRSPRLQVWGPSCDQFPNHERPRFWLSQISLAISEVPWVVILIDK